jgi:hypothetical protein
VRRRTPRLWARSEADSGAHTGCRRRRAHVDGRQMPGPTKDLVPHALGRHRATTTDAKPEAAMVAAA